MSSIVNVDKLLTESFMHVRDKGNEQNVEALKKVTSVVANLTNGVCQLKRSDGGSYHRRIEKEDLEKIEKFKGTADLKSLNSLMLEITRKMVNLVVSFEVSLQIETQDHLAELRSDIGKSELNAPIMIDVLQAPDKTDKDFIILFGVRSIDIVAMALKPASLVEKKD